jgi:hypothetical protein
LDTPEGRGIFVMAKPEMKGRKVLKTLPSSKESTKTRNCNAVLEKPWNREDSLKERHVGAFSSSETTENLRQFGFDARSSFQ